MIKILSTVKTERLPLEDQWRLLEDYRVQLAPDLILTVPRGFIYDKASVPRAAWAFIPRDDRKIEDAALVHDWLYYDQKIDGLWCNRLTADRIFLEMLKLAGMGLIRRVAAYDAVRAFGWTFFNKRAKEIGNEWHD